MAAVSFSGLNGIDYRCDDQRTVEVLKTTRDSVTTTLTGVANQIAAAHARLVLRRTRLQQQFAAADEVISKLNSMTGQRSQQGSAKLF